MNAKSFSQINTLLFDLDGTLLDSFQVHLEIFKVTLSNFGVRLTTEDFLEHYSPNWYKTYEALGLKKENWAAADSFWLAEAEKRTAKLFPNVKGTLNNLSEKFTLGIVTSGSKVRVERDLKATGVYNFFKVIITGDDINNPKPSPEGLRFAIERLNIKAENAIYIGDSSSDYEMAIAAGVYFIGISSEFNNLKNIHPDYSIHSLTDLPKLIGVV